MSKRNIAYVKPEEPSFLRKIKEQIGYKEGPTVETKKEEQLPVNPEDLQDTEDEQPTVVVLNPGDLTAEEASTVKAHLDKEAEDTPADLNARIFFRKPDKPGKSTITPSDSTKEQSRAKKRSNEEDKTSKNKKKTSSLLSFNDEEDDY